MVCHVLAPSFFVGWRPKNWGIDTVLLMVLSILIQIEDLKSVFLDVGQRDGKVWWSEQYLGKWLEVGGWIVLDRNP